MIPKCLLLVHAIEIWKFFILYYAYVKSLNTHEGAENFENKPTMLRPCFR
jgi:hypothetical protein